MKNRICNGYKLFLEKKKTLYFSSNYFSNNNKTTTKEKLITQAITFTESKAKMNSFFSVFSSSYIALQGVEDNFVGAKNANRFITNYLYNVDLVVDK